MNIESHDLFAKHYVPMAQAHLEVGRALDAETVQVQPSRDLSADLWRLKATGLLPIGSAEFVGRGSMGMGFEARKQAAAIGASVVLFRLTPAKIKTIRRGPDGAIASIARRILAFASAFCCSTSRCLLMMANV